MISTIRTLLLLCFAIRLSEGNLTNDSIDLCSVDDVNYDNYTSLKLENCGCEQMCIRKCCRSGFYYYHEGNFKDGQLTGRCVKGDSINFSVPIYDVDRKIKDLYGGFSVGVLNCTDQDVVEEVDLEREDSVYNFYIQEDGIWYYPHLNTRNNYTDYCVNRKNGRTTYFYCKDLVNDNTILRRAGVTIPIPFLLATALVYAILSKWSIHRKALILHTLCLALCYMLQTVNQFDIMENVMMCKTLGVLMLYLWYASLFWLNAMCIDIWLTFSGLHGFRRRLGKENVLFFILSVYAWGAAALYLSVTRSLDVTSPSPNIYNKGCFKIILLSYWFYFVTITMFTALNTIFHILTTINIRRAKREATVLNGVDSGKHTSEGDEKFIIYWNLFCTMSIHSILFYVRLLHITLERLKWHKSAAFDIFVHILYISYSIVIFIVFVCKKRIWKELKERYRQFTRKSKDNESSTSTTISSKSPTEIAVCDIHLKSFKNINKDGIWSEIYI